ncbi:hypothetical protein HDU93_005576 [Gonapodya sp. JEL0774]|nr:hypothetical protein HDU93_005576 [Gonapodya sp. JEL0774]
MYAYTWPSALVLSFWIARNLNHLLTSSSGHCPEPMEILELGSGTGLVGTLAAKSLRVLGYENFRVVLTDLSEPDWLLENLSRTVDSSGLARDGRILVTPLEWGKFHKPVSTIMDLCPDKQDNDVGALEKALSVLAPFLESELQASTPYTNTSISPFTNLRYILGADLFYDPSQFSDLLCTVSYILHKFPDATFFTAYHERSSKRSIVDKLAKWELKGKVRPWGFGEDELGEWWLAWKRERARTHLEQERDSVNMEQTISTVSVKQSPPFHQQRAATLRQYIAPSLALYESDSDEHLESSSDVSVGGCNPQNEEALVEEGAGDRFYSESSESGRKIEFEDSDSNSAQRTESSNDNEEEDLYARDLATFLATFDGIFLLEITLDTPSMKPS